MLFERITGMSLTASLSSWNITKEHQDLLSHYYCGAEFLRSNLKDISVTFLWKPANQNHLLVRDFWSLLHGRTKINAMNMTDIWSSPQSQILPVSSRRKCYYLKSFQRGYTKQGTPWTWSYPASPDSPQPAEFLFAWPLSVIQKPSWLCPHTVG